MNKQWYCAINDKQLGPLSESDLTQMLSRGEISKETLVWAEGMNEWQTISSLKEEFSKSIHNDKLGQDVSVPSKIALNENVSCLKMICPECGNKIEDDSKFCGHCGHPVESDTKKETTVNKDEPVSNKEIIQQISAVESVKTKYPWKWLFGIIVACIVVGGLFYTYKTRDYRSGSSTTVPRFLNYGTDMEALHKYISDLDDTPIDVCRTSSGADAIYCLARREANENLLREAANLWHPLAQNDLALVLDAKKSQGDSVEIASLIRESANKGIPHAQVTVGWWHMTGEHGFDIDYTEAMKWNLLGYKQGHSEGANNIGELYEKGLGVAKDLEQAKSWYKKASQLGNAQATERLKKLAESETTISPSFQCSKATTAAERFICSSKALADADVQMAQSYKAVMARTADKQALKREQLAWLKNERDVCTDEDAMLKVYQERIEQLSTR